MKKALIAILALSASAAFAQQVTGFTKYDYDKAVNDGGTVQELAVGVAVGTSIGTFDAAAVGNRYSFGSVENVTGSEFGYSNGVNLLAGKVVGRAALGQRNGVPGGNVRYYSLGAEFTAPVTEKLGVFAGYRHRNSTNFKSVENRYVVGVDYAVTKNLAARVGYATTKRDGVSFNGVTSALSYAF